MLLLEVDWSTVMINSLGEGLGALGLLTLLGVISLLFRPVRRFFSKLMQAVEINENFMEHKEQMKVVQKQNDEMYSEFKIEHSNMVANLQKELDTMRLQKQTKLEEILDDVRKEVTSMKDEMHKVTQKMGIIRNIEKDHSLMKKQHAEMRKIVMQNNGTLEQLMKNQNKAAA